MKDITKEQKEKFIQNTSMFVRFGFAVGSYICTCSKCDTGFYGDKRAYVCFDCANSKLEDPTMHKRYKLPAMFSDGNSWSIVDTQAQAAECIKECIECMDDQDLLDLCGVTDVYMTDAECEALPEL